MRSRLRAVLALLTLMAGVTTLLSGCQRDYSGLRLTIATGGSQGVYFKLGGALADQWYSEFGIPRATVDQTAGSPANIALLRAHKADVAFSAADAATDAVTAPQQPDVPQIRALARIYDDYVHVVVRANSPVQRLTDLRGLNVSVGSRNSGVELIAQRLMQAAGLNLDTDLNAVRLNLNDSLEALAHRRIDAFFWSGGLPTPGIVTLEKALPLRLLDLSDVLPALRNRYPVYEPATIPPSAYHLAGGPIATLVVPNYLLVTDEMGNDVAEALVRGLFDGQPRLVAVNSAALSIDVHSAIETEPVPLHPGAINFYRDAKP